MIIVRYRQDWWSSGCRGVVLLRQGWGNFLFLGVALC